ncbi:MAG TPA: serine/threonine-protein kinase, partial [Polyangiaceae bacterium]|nr:serine/threonine-protein kinase [Polyangiaceae bacterium]
HGAGIIHRDLKPDNVYLLKSRGGKADFVKLLDFGISKFNQLGGDSGFSMTRTGAVMGTPYYMAPEQAKGSRDLDHRVDLYAAGVILYEAITGEVPFNADTFNELLFKIVLETARPVESVVPGIDPNFAAIVNKSMAREPAARFQSAREFQQVLEQWAAGAGPQLAVALNASAQAPGGAAPYGAVSTGQYPAAAPAHTLGKTPGTWGQTAADAVPKRSNAGLFVGLGVIGVLMLGGAGLVALKLSAGRGDAVAAAKAETEKAEAERNKAEHAEKHAREQAEQAEAERLKAEQAAREQATRAAADAEKAEAEAASAAKVAKVPLAPAAPRPQTRPPAAKPEAKPVPATASTGRRIRTQL